MLAFGMYGNKEASTTRSPSSPRTRLLPGSTPACSSPAPLPRAGGGGGLPAHAHLARAGGVQGGLGVLRDPLEDLLVVLDAWSGRQLTAVERVEGRLVEDQPRDADGLAPLAPVLVRGEVVEAQG